MVTEFFFSRQSKDERLTAYTLHIKDIFCFLQKVHLENILRVLKCEYHPCFKLYHHLQEENLDAALALPGNQQFQTQLKQKENESPNSP